MDFNANGLRDATPASRRDKNMDFNGATKILIANKKLAEIFRFFLYF